MNRDEQQAVAREIDQELAALSPRPKATGLGVLSYHVDMARLEAANAAHQH